ncbi:MAG: hypothetical protein EOO78_10215, partial [Oxalobacteraceae bacterium]
MPYRPAAHAVIRALACSLLLGGLAQAAGVRPVLLGIDGEFGLDNSTSAQAVELGMRTAVQEINAAGGVLHGRIDFLD